MPEPLDGALAALRPLLLDPDRLVRAVAAGRRRNTQPRWKRAELTPVRVKAGPRLQLSLYDDSRPAARNLAWGPDAAAAVDELLAEPYGNWHVTTTDTVIQLRVTKRGEAQVHRTAATAEKSEAHDRAKSHLPDPGDPLYTVIGGDAAKRRQVDAFLRALDAVLPTNAAVAATGLEPGNDSPPEGDLPVPLRVADLGCGNAYLTFAAYRYLSSTRGLDVTLTGVDVRADQRRRNTELAERLGWSDRVSFVAGSIDGVVLDPPPHVVLALHACDTATDDALARAVAWRSPYVLAAPCCHHDIAAQLRRAQPPDPYAAVTRHGILRERYADVLTDSLRATLLRLAGYKVDVVEFIDSAHTPRNLLLRARLTAAPPPPGLAAEYRSLTAAWGITPHLATLLDAAASRP